MCINCFAGYLNCCLSVTLINYWYHSLFEIGIRVNGCYWVQLVSQLSRCNLGFSVIMCSINANALGIWSWWVFLIISWKMLIPRVSERLEYLECYRYHLSGDILRIILSFVICFEPPVAFGITGYIDLTKPESIISSNRLFPKFSFGYMSKK